MSSCSAASSGESDKLIAVFSPPPHQEELKRDLAKLRREKERAQAAASQAAAAAAAAAHAQSGLSSAAAAALTASGHKRKREDERDATSVKAKKKKMISTTSKATTKDTKLYCVCKTPYDETKYIYLQSLSTHSWP